MISLPHTPRSPSHAAGDGAVVWTTAHSPSVADTSFLAVQGDGCAQLLCKSERDMEIVMDLVQKELGMACMPLQIGKAEPVAQALIPAASFSQQLFPASK